MREPKSSRSFRNHERPTASRTITGCRKCRRRRKKRDDVKPNCLGCTRNFLECIWPTTLVAYKYPNQPSRPTLLQEMLPALVSPKAGDREFHFVIDKRFYLSEQEACAQTPLEIEEECEVERPTSPTLWQAPTASFRCTERPVSLTRNSYLLLQHYLEHTSKFLAPQPVSSNPFVTLILPLAYFDDLLMHAVLALSGTHLSFRKSGNLEIQLATQQHYSSLLRTLQLVFIEESIQKDVARTLRLLLVLVVLYHVEAVSGESCGGIFPYLRAFRELIIRVLQDPDMGVKDDAKLTKGFALEVYSYLVLANSITPYGRDEARTIPFDPFFNSLDFLKEYETFGVFFNRGQGLFETIPQISILAMNKLAEEESATWCPESQSTYESLHSKLADWQPRPAPDGMAEWASENVWAGKIYHQALLVFLKASMCGSVVNNPKAVVAIQRHIDLAMSLFVPVSSSPFATIMLWPVMIIGSCLIRGDQRSVMSRELKSEAKIDIPQVVQASRLLQFLWKTSTGALMVHLTCILS